ncbi:rhamnulokinase family protein [Candidatus Nephthysia bennettiae]
MGGPLRSESAVDLGAESGRVMMAQFDGRRLRMQEMHRFPNRPVNVAGHRFWNILSLWSEVLTGLAKIRHAVGALDSIGVDGWRVDYGLVDAGGLLLGQPYHYRDERTTGVIEAIADVIPKAELYTRTGIQFLPINTICQLYAHERLRPGELDSADRMLMIPDLLHNWLSGSLVTERTNASTTQFWQATAGGWAVDLLARLGIPTAMLPAAVEPGQVIGTVRPELRSTVGPALVIAPATHDTGSAVAALPTTRSGGWAYISSGTWSLVGVELDHPVVTDEALAANCTNEGGVFQTTRLLKNVTGMWLLEQCRVAWAGTGQRVSYDSLLSHIDEAESFAALINPDDPLFWAPPDMLAAINEFLSTHGQRPIQAQSEVVRCILESLVLRYCNVLATVTRLSGSPIDRVHIVGGGARNTRLCQWLADALDLPVIAGPNEATARGNALMQLVGLRELGSLQEVRAVGTVTASRQSLPRSGEHSKWVEARQRLEELSGDGSLKASTG